MAHEAVALRLGRTHQRSPRVMHKRSVAHKRFARAHMQNHRSRFILACVAPLLIGVACSNGADAPARSAADGGAGTGPTKSGAAGGTGTGGGTAGTTTAGTAGTGNETS